MGVEYAIVCNATHTAYDLGKGGWYVWSEGALPTSLEQTRAEIDRIMEYWDVDDAYRERVAVEAWAFIEAHPGCRVVNDTHDVKWGRRAYDEADDGDRDCFGDDIFNQIGTRYVCLHLSRLDSLPPRCGVCGVVIAESAP